MTKLSVNINKIATLRNSRGGDLPNVVQFAKDVQSFGAEGVTIHPRPDERHIRYKDAYDLKPIVHTEYNIEGNPIPKFIDMVLEIKPTQVTLVPDAIDALTSNAFPVTVTALPPLSASCVKIQLLVVLASRVREMILANKPSAILNLLVF